MSEPAKTPAPPYYAVIFTSIRKPGDNGYAEMANAMEALAAKQPGFLGFETARQEIGISVSYWTDLTAIQAWKDNAEHQQAQKKPDNGIRRFVCGSAGLKRSMDFNGRAWMEFLAPRSLCFIISNSCLFTTDTK